MASEPAAGLEPAHLVVGRLRRPHGLKGDCAVFPLTGEPDFVFAPGRSVWVRNLKGDVVAGPLVIARSRAYHREWLMAFAGWADRGAVEPLSDMLLTAPRDTLQPLEDGEVYLHDLIGFAVETAGGEALGVVSDASELPGGLMLKVQGRKREFLLPYRKEFVKRVDREGRRLGVELPPGLVD